MEMLKAIPSVQSSVQAQRRGTLKCTTEVHQLRRIDFEECLPKSGGLKLDISINERPIGHSRFFGKTKSKSIRESLPADRPKKPRLKIS